MRDSINRSYHVHSVFSDGNSTISDIAKEAVKIGLNEIGFSDHFVYPFSDVELEWTMREVDLPRYFAEIDEVEVRFGDKIKVKRGIEADYMPKTIDKVKKIIDKYPLDYVIGSVHIVDDFCVDECKENWEKLTETEREEIIYKYWVRVKELAESGVFDIIAHLDLYKKFGYLPTNDISEAISSAIDAIAKSGMAIELNTSGWHKDICEVYPSPEILKLAYKKNIPILITADAHNPEHLVRDFEKAYELLKSIGFTDVVSFDMRKQIKHSL